MYIKFTNKLRRENSEIENKQRDYLFDNLKAILIILVVLGHIMERFGLFPKLRGVIYVFHMPFFIFISGYFSKNLKNIESKLVKNILIPFFIFNTIYMLCIEECYYTSFEDRLKNLNIFRASYLYWYLISLFVWRILIKYIVKFKYSIIILFIFSLYVGLINDANRFLSISRTISFFPFFMLGYYTNKEKIEMIRNINKGYSILMLILSIFITFILSDNFINIDLFKNAQSYKYSNVTNLKGICIRIYQFIVAIVISISIMNLISSKSNFLSTIGQKTISIYLLSPFVQEIIYKTIKFIMPDIIVNDLLTLCIFVLISAIIVIFCSLDKINKIYNKFINFIYQKITINELKLLEDKK